MDVKKINTLSLFAGGGGLDLGFAAAGFNICCSSDIDAHSCKSLKINQKRSDLFTPHDVICGDIADLTAEKLLKNSDNKKEYFNKR